MALAAAVGTTGKAGGIAEEEEESRRLSCCECRCAATKARKKATTRTTMDTRVTSIKGFIRLRIHGLGVDVSLGFQEFVE